MVTGASTADVSVSSSTHGAASSSSQSATRSSALLLGIPEMVVAINKIDLVEYSQERYEEIVEEFEGFATKLTGVDEHHVHPDVGPRGRQRRLPLAGDALV